MKMLSRQRKMDKRPLKGMMITSTTAASSFFYFLFLFFSITTCPTTATIKGPPTAERKEITKIVRMGDTLKLQCPMNGSPPMQFDWTKDNEQIKPYAWPRFKTQKKNLKIKPVMPDDTGIYICKGTNGFGSEEIRIDLIVIDPKDFPGLKEGEIPEVAPPVLTMETRDHRSAYRKNAGDNFRLTCEALGKPEPDIIWYKDDVEMSGHMIGSSSSRTGGKALFTIKNVQPSNSGMYTCRARNSLGTVSRNFTLDVIPSQNEPDLLDNPHQNELGMYSFGDEFAKSHIDGGLLMPSGPKNTTVVEGNRAVLECRVHSTIKSNIMWLKKLEKDEDEAYVKNGQTAIIPVGTDRFKLIQKNKQTEEEVKVNSRSVDILNTMEIPHSELEDSGMYICFVKNPSGYKFKSAYLNVVPRNNVENSGSGAKNEEQESASILILIVCLAIVVMALTVTIIACFLKRRKKKAAHSSNTSSSSSSENAPELTENLMRQQQQQHHQQQNHQQNFQQPNQHYTLNSYTSTSHPIQPQQYMQRNILQQQQPSLYQQPYNQQQQQQLIYSQQQRVQHPAAANNNHRNNMNSQMSIMVNKMSDTPLPPAPPPPPPSLHNEWNPSSLYNGGGGSIATDSIVDATGAPVISMYNSNLHHHIQQQQQNQYEVPHAHTRFVPGGPPSNDKPGSIFEPGNQRHIYNPRSHY